jgi:hypothetical protein
VWQLPNVSGRPPNCWDSISDSQGNSYVLTEEAAGNPIVESLSPSGAIRWTASTEGFSNWRTGPVVGADGSVFFSMWNGIQSKVVGYNEQTGAVTLEQPFEDVTGLHAYEDGIIVVDTDSTVMYLSYTGSITAEYSTGPPISAYEAYSNAAGADGTVFVAGYSSADEPHASVEEVTPAGVAWTWTDPDSYLAQTFLAAAPDGGVILARGETNPSADFTSLSATGSELWTNDMQGPIGPAQDGGYLPVRVDVNGVVALPALAIYRCAIRPTEECLGDQIELVSQQTDATIFPPIDVQAGPEYNFITYSVALDSGQLYVSGESEEPSSTPTLMAFSTPSLGKDYQVALAEALTDKASPSPQSSGGVGGGGSSTSGSDGGSPSSGCPSYMVIDSRGSGEAAGIISPPGKAFAAEFETLHRPARIAVLANPYPAVSILGGWREVLNLLGAKLGIGPLGAYHGSVVAGEKWLQSNIAFETGTCPSTKLLLTGYSQGAQVTGDVYQRDISSVERQHILAVVLFGDPYFDSSDSANDRGNFAHDGRGGILGVRRSFHGDSRVVSYCHLHDPICQHPTIVGFLKYHLKQHTNYTPDGVAAAKHF